MAASASGMDRLVTLLGGWPDHFKKKERQHGESLLAVLRRDKVLDEAVFGLVIRYAIHRAAFDRLSAEINKEKFKATDSSYLSGKEQSRAFHENKLLTLERELLATPYARTKNGMSSQTSFMDLFEEEPTNESKVGKVTPFRPMRRNGQA